MRTLPTGVVGTSSQLTVDKVQYSVISESHFNEIILSFPKPTCTPDLRVATMDRFAVAAAQTAGRGARSAPLPFDGAAGTESPLSPPSPSGKGEGGWGE